MARARVRQLLAHEEDVEVVAEACDGREAVEAIRRTRPDIAFLDIQMPEMDAFQALQKLGSELSPAIVFVTAYDQHALRAFDVAAADYLLKPFDRERFRLAVGRARERATKDGRVTRDVLDLLREVRESSPYLDRLAIKESGRIRFVRLEEVECIEACGNYVRLCTDQGARLLRETMAALEARLDPRCFQRIHRSAIVNVEAIREIQPAFHGDCVVLLASGRRLTLSRGYRDRLQRLLDACSAGK